MMNVKAKDSFDILDQENMRKTKGRKAILEILKEAEPKTADEIYLKLQSSDKPISLSTVYRTCETLAKKGVILKSNLINDGKVRYEYHEISHIHHAVCMSCHKIIPIDDCPFGEFDKLMENKYDFEVRSHRLVIYGYCSACKVNQKR